MIMTDFSVKSHTNKVLKHYHKGKSPERFEYRTYNDKRLCAILFLRKYFYKLEKKEDLSTKKFRLH